VDVGVGVAVGAGAASTHTVFEASPSIFPVKIALTKKQYAVVLERLSAVSEREDTSDNFRADDAPTFLSKEYTRYERTVAWPAGASQAKVTRAALAAVADADNPKSTNRDNARGRLRLEKTADSMKTFRKNHLPWIWAR